MEVADINPKSVAEAVGGTVDHSGCVICLCPIHETGGGAFAVPGLSITDDRRILFTCRSQKCDKKHAREIMRFLVEKGLPQSHVGGMHAAQTFPTWDYLYGGGGVFLDQAEDRIEGGQEEFCLRRLRPREQRLGHKITAGRCAAAVQSADHRPGDGYGARHAR